MQRQPTQVQALTSTAAAARGGAPSLASASSGAVVEAQRALAEVQAQALMAKQFPRDEIRSFERIMAACSRPKLAEVALYAYKRGGQIVSGPSIRLAEVLAQAWGNIMCGVKEVEQRDGESTMLAYAWDAETNYREVREFVVPHERDVDGGSKPLTSSRDIYEHTANLAARRKRACILAVIPRDVVDEAVSRCLETQAGDATVPLVDRARRMAADFAAHGVTVDMIEARLGHPLAAISAPQLAQLRQIYQSISDGVSTRGQWFERPATAKASATAQDLTARLKAGAPASPSSSVAAAPETAPAVNA